MKPGLPYIFNLITFGLSFFAVKAQDTTRIVQQSGLELAIDYGKLLLAPTDFETKLEISAGYRFKNWVPNVQLGYAQLNPRGAYENGAFEASGMYVSAGINYLTPLDATNSLYFGLQYSMSQYEDQYTYIIGSPIWPDFEQSEVRKDLQAQWAALVFGSESKISDSGFYVGGEFNLRLMIAYDEFEPIDTYAVPGYGRTIDKTVPAVNLYIKFLF